MTMSTFPYVLQCGGLCDEAADAISTESWDSLEKKALLWSDLDKFGDVHASVDWGNAEATSLSKSVWHVLSFD